MTVAILHRESFGYGQADMTQFYLSISRSTNGPFGSIAPPNFSNTQLLQWGRGTGADQRYALRGNTSAALAVRATQLGFGGHVASGFGMCFAYNQAGQVGGSVLCEFWDDDADNDGSFAHTALQLSIETLADGRIVARRWPIVAGIPVSTVIGNPSDYILPIGVNAQAGAFTHIEVIPVINSSTGSVLVYADGNLVLNLTSANTNSGGSGKVGYFQLCCLNNAVACDWLITDGSGRKGDRAVGCYAATVIGSMTAGTPVGDSTLLKCIDEQAMDGDTTYVLLDGSALPKGVSATTAPLPANAVTVDEVSPLVFLEKDDGGVDTSRTIFISGATTDDGGVDLAASTAYLRSAGIAPMRAYALDPNAGPGAWTIPTANAVEIGQKRTA